MREGCFASTRADTTWSRDVVCNLKQGSFDMNRNGPCSEESSANSRWYSASSHQLPFSLMQASLQVEKWLSMFVMRPMHLHRMPVELRTWPLHLSSGLLYLSSRLSHLSSSLACLESKAGCFQSCVALCESFLHRILKATRSARVELMFPKSLPIIARVQSELLEARAELLNIKRSCWTLNGAAGDQAELLEIRRSYSKSHGAAGD